MSKIFLFKIKNCALTLFFLFALNGYAYKPVSNPNVVSNFLDFSILKNNNFIINDSDNLQVSFTTYHFNPTASSQTLAITSNINWAISGMPGWLTLSASSGSNNANITLTSQTNSTTTTRSATLTLTGNAITRTITVIQYGTTTLTVALNLSNVEKDISNKPLGMNMNYLMDGTVLGTNVPAQTAVALKNMGTKFLRYPGGEKSDNFFWATSPFTNGANPKSTNCMWPSNETRFFNVDKVNANSVVLDFDEFMTMSIAADGEPVIVVPYDCIYPIPNTDCGARAIPTKAQVITNAVEWVRYANVVKGYNIKYWMIGNECWADASYNGKPTAAQYAADIVDFSDAMKAIDPTIKIVANGNNSFWASFLTPAVAAKIDMLTVSSYPTWNYTGGYNFYKNNNVALDGEVTSAVNAVNGIANASDRNRITVSVAEFNTIDFNSAWSRDNNLGHALATFECFGQIIKHQKLDFACFWNTRWTNNAAIPFAEDLYDAIDPASNLTAAGKAIKIWGDFTLPKLLVSNSSNPVKTFTTYNPATNQLNVLLINKETTSQTINVTTGALPTGSTLTRWAFTGTGEADKFPAFTQSGTPTVVTGSDVYASLAPVSITVLSFSPTTNLTASPNNFYFANDATSQSLAITSNINWTITNLPSWLSASLTNGSSSQSVNLITTANASANPRSATITLSDGTVTISIPVTQAGLPDNTAPTTPTSLTSASIASTSFTLNWNASTDAVGVTAYEVYANGVFVASTSSATFNLTALSPGTAYSMSVRAKDAAGNFSALSTPLPVNTSGTNLNLGFESVVSSNFVSWVEYDSWSINTTPIHVHSGTISGLFSGGGAYNIINLTPGATYRVTGWAKAATGSNIWISVTNFNGGQNPGRQVLSTSWTQYTIDFTLGTGNTQATLGVWTDIGTSAYFDSFTLTQIIADNTPPTQPTALVASGITQTGFTLNWAASLDVGGVTGYEIYRNNTLIGSSATTNFNVTNLIAGTVYNFTVRARDAIPNWSAQSAVLTVTSASPTNYYFNSTSSNLTVLANWGTNTNGTGPSPLNFISDGDKFILTSSKTLGGILTLGANTIFQIGEPLIAGVTLTINASGNIRTGTVNITSAFSGSNTLTIAGIASPILGTLATGTTGCTVTYNGTVAQTLVNAVYNNLTLNNLAGINATSNITVIGALTLTNGKFGIGSNTLTLNGAVSTTAGNSLSANGSSNLVITGTTPASINLFFDQTTPGIATGNGTTALVNGTTNRLMNFTLGTVGQASKNVTLGNQLQITGVMRLSSGTFNAGTVGNLVLLSTATTTAHLATLQTGTFPSDLAGTVNVQSFFKGDPLDDRYYRGFRMISSPVLETTPTPTLFSNMKNRFIITGAAGGGFDIGSAQRPNAATLQAYKEIPALQNQSYVHVTNILTTPFELGKGYYFFYRGNRLNATTSKVNAGVSPYLAGRFMPPENWTATFIGTVNKGDIDIPVTFTNNAADTFNGYNLIGNPYPSTIDFSKNSNSIINNTENAGRLTNFLYIMKPDRSGFATQSGGVTSNAINPGDDIRIIQPGQGFFVKVTSSGTIRIKESNKNGGTIPVRLLAQPDENGYTITRNKTLKKVSDAETSSTRQLVRLRLVDGTRHEETTLVLEPGNKEIFEGFDAVYFGSNGDLTCNTLTSNGINTAINFLPPASEVSEIKIAVNAAETKPNYKLMFTDLTGVLNYDLLLKDNYLNSLTTIDFNHNQYTFGIDKNIATTFGNNRFVLLLSPKSTLPIKLKDFTANKKNTEVLLNWETLYQKDVSHFEMERSTDGEPFALIGKIPATGNRTATTTYNFTDKTPKKGFNYYRLKTVDDDGKIDVSIVRLVNFNIQDDEKLTIYPNPVKNDLNVKWNVAVAGDKIISVVDLNGKKVFEIKNIKENTLNKNIQFLKKGFYILELSNQSTGQIISRRKFIKEG